MDNALLEILVAWALVLSPYTLNSLNLEEIPLPIVIEKPYTFFVENVCGGIEKKCRGVIGWYNNDKVIYINETMSLSLIDRVVVHEITHYIQDLSGKYDNSSCEDSDYREFEAKKVEGEYMLRVKGQIPYFSAPIKCKK